MAYASSKLCELISSHCFRAASFAMKYSKNIARGTADPWYQVYNRVWRIYSNIRIFEYFWSEYLFGYSFVSFLGYEYIRIFVRVIFLDTNIFGYSFAARFWFEYIRIFVRINFQDTNRFRRCFYWFSLDIILCLWIFCWYQWSKMLFKL